MATVIAFDYGKRRVGVAIGDLRLRIAHPLDTIDCSDQQRFEEKLKGLLNEWSPSQLIVGMPVDPKGGEHSLSKSVREFGRKVSTIFKSPVVFVNENYTSVEAESFLNSIGLRGISQKKHLDSVAAKTILEDYFENYE